MTGSRDGTVAFADVLQGASAASLATPPDESAAGLPAASLSALLLELYGFAARRGNMAECCAKVAAVLDCRWAALVRMVGDGSRDQALAVGAPPGEAPPEASDLLAALRGFDGLDGTLAGLAPGAGPRLFPPSLAPAAARPCGAPWAVAALARKDDCRYLLCLGPARGADAGGVMGRLDLLLPHLRQALSLRDAVDVHRTIVQVNSSVLDRAPSAFIAMTADGTVVFQNEPARHLLAQADGIALVGRRLSAHDRRLDEALAEALGELRGCDGEGAIESRDLLAARPSGAQPFLVTLLPVLVGGDDTILLPRRWLLAVITDPAAGRLPSRNYLQQVFGLSPAEARVCQQLGGGRELDDVARGLNLSLATVKSHLLRIYQKLGVNSRAQLVERLQGHFWASTPIIIRLDHDGGAAAR